MSVITALFLKMGKVTPYFKMTPELANQLHSYLGKIMMYAKSSGAKLTQKQQDFIMDQTKQLDLYEKSMMPPTGPKAEVIELKPRPESPYGKPGGWMPDEEETKGIMSRVKFDEDLVQDTVDLLKGKTDTKSFQDEIKKIIGRKGTYADYSDAEIKGILDGIEADTKKQIKSAEEIIDEGDFDPSGMKDGGRIGYATGAGVKAYRGIKALMDKVNKRFGKETLKTADDVARPESAINRDLFKKMSDKLKGKAPEKAGQGQFTKAEVVIGRLQNTLNDIKPGDEDYEYVSKTFPNWIKEIQAKPQLADNENVFQRLAMEGLPENQRLKIYDDGTVDFETLKPTHTFKLKEEIKRKLNAKGGLNYLMGL